MLNRKKLTQGMKEYDSNLVRDALFESEYTDQNNINKILIKNIRSTRHLITNQSDRRKRRDEIFELLMSISKSKDVIDEIERVLFICRETERLIDIISGDLNSSDIIKEDISVQFSSFIYLSLYDFGQLKEMVTQWVESREPSKPLIQQSNMVIETHDGGSIDPDMMLSNLINSLSLTLKFIYFNSGGSSDGVIEIDLSDDFDFDNIKSTARVMELATHWNYIIESAKSCIVFRNKMEFSKKSKSYIYDRTVSDYEHYDLISNIRMKNKIHQNMMESISISKIPYVMGYDDFTDNQKICSLVFIMECLSVRDKNFKVSGISLSEWCDGYYGLVKLSNKDPVHIYRKNDLIQWFVKFGLSEVAAKKFLDIVTFNEKSVDLFDSPVLRVKGERFFIYYPALFNPSIPNVILSVFSSMNIDLSKKGRFFEKEFSRFLNSKGIKNKAFSFKLNNEIYEYDSIFLFEGKAFIVECKNTSLSGGNVDRAYDKINLLEGAVQQVQRLRDGIINNPEKFKEHFSEDINEFEVVMVVMNNLPLSIPEGIDGVYITDYSSFSKLIKSENITLTMLSSDGSKSLPMSSLWRGDSLSSNDIIRSMNNPIQVKMLTDFKIKVEDFWNIGGYDIKYKNISFDHGKMNESISKKLSF